MVLCVGVSEAASALLVCSTVTDWLRLELRSFICENKAWHSREKLNINVKTNNDEKSNKKYRFSKSYSQSIFLVDFLSTVRVRHTSVHTESADFQGSIANALSLL